MKILILRTCRKSVVDLASTEFNWHIKKAEQRTIIQQYHGTLAVVTIDTARRGVWAGCGHAQTPLLAVPNVTAYQLTASVPTSYYSMWPFHYRGLIYSTGWSWLPN